MAEDRSKLGAITRTRVVTEKTYEIRLSPDNILELLNFYRMHKNPQGVMLVPSSAEFDYEDEMTYFRWKEREEEDDGTL